MAHRETDSTVSLRTPRRVLLYDTASSTARLADLITQWGFSVEVLADMDRGGVGTAWMMSTGYLAESPMMVPPLANAPALVHAANAFTVGQARAHPDRLVAFIGVNPLTPTALAEIAAWKDEPFATGVKIHLTNSDVDLRDPDQVFRLAAVFDAAAAAGMTIMIHMRRGPTTMARETCGSSPSRSCRWQGPPR